MSDSVEVVVDNKASFGEGPIWDERAGLVRWVDFSAHQVHNTDPLTGSDFTIGVGQPVGSIAPRRSGGLIVALEHGLASLDLQLGRVSMICDPENNRSGVHFNDGKCDAAGRFWVGSVSAIDNAGQISVDVGGANLYRLDPDLSVHHMLSQVSVSNGLAWSSDHRTMYYIDSLTRAVAAFDFDLATGTISNRRDAVRIPEADGMPDGMTIDAEGMLWVALFSGGCVARYNPVSGQLLRKLQVPGEVVTSCCFGGANLDQLFITTVHSLYKAMPGVRGTKTEMFAG